MIKKSVLLTALAIAGFAVTGLAQTVPAYVPTSGLVGWWPFNGNAIDESVNTNDGTVNGATLTTDRFGNANSAYSFDGVSNSIEVNRNYQSAFSLSIWFNPSISPQYNPLVDAFDTNWEIQLKNTSPDYVSFITTNNYQEFISSQTTTANNWYHLVCTYTLNTITLYLNGIQIDQHTVNPLPNNNGNYYFGASLTGTDQFYTGKLDDIGIWNRALTPSEITDLYNACSATSIVSQPTNQTLASGSNAVFTVSATAGSTLQWQTNLGLGFQNLSNAGQYSGVTTQTLTVSSIGVNNNNQTFRCIVGSGSCSDTSNVATLSLSTVGVEDLSLLKNVELYPNPATAELHIKSALKFSSIKIINNVGQLVLNKDAANAIDVSSLSKGIYFVNLINAQGVTIETRKIVLQ